MFIPQVETKYKPTKVSPSSEDHWKELRQKGVGGSEIGAILGINKYRTGYDVWLEKTGRKINNVDNQYVRVGKKIETAVASLAEEDHNIAINKSSIPDILYIHPEKPHLRVTPDRIYWNLNLERNNQGILECKNTLKDINPEEIKNWDVQVIYAMTILGVKFGMLAWLERGAYRWYKYYEMNQENIDYAKYIIEEIDHFWNDHVLKDVPPEPKTGMETEEMYEKENAEETITATDKIKESVERLRQVKEKKKEYEEEEKQLKNDIKIFMRSAEVITDETGENKLAKWKKVNGSPKFDQSSFKEDYPELFKQYTKQGKGYRRLSIPKPKK